MTEGGKRRANKSLKQWVAFVKKVAKEEGLEYKDAMQRAKVRSDKGEKWQKGGNGDSPAAASTEEKKNDTPAQTPAETPAPAAEEKTVGEGEQPSTGGQRQRQQSRQQSKQRRSARQQRKGGQRNRQQSRRNRRQSRRDRR